MVNLQHNLPAQPTSFVGREKEVAAIIELLEDRHCRLLTLVGPGGIGKTRLAIEVGRHLAGSVRDGVYFVSFESLPSADYVLSTLIDRLGLDLSGQADKQYVLVGMLKAKQLVIVLDNFEHVHEATPLLSQILSGAGSVKLLVTSREPLKLREEWVHRVEGLSFPQADTDSIDYGAMHLFAERARQVQVNFKLEDHRQSVARITRLTEGMPLALELAASWVHLLAPDDIAAELENSLDLLETDISNMPDRHRSIRASFDLSMSQLGDEGRVVFYKLSVFQGSFTFGAAKHIAGATLPVLKRLVDQSMLRAETNRQYSMHELLRQYASDYLDAADPLFAQHSAYYLDLLATLEPDMKGDNHIAARQQIDQQIDNIRLAWDQGVRDGDLKRLQDAADSLAIYFSYDYYGDEGVRTFYKLVEITEGPIKGRFLLLVGWHSVFLGKHDDGLRSMLAGRALLRSKDDYVGSAMALALLCWFEESSELDFNELRQMYSSCATYAESIGRQWEQAWFLYGLGNTLKVLAEEENALDVLRQSEALFWACGDRLSTSWSVGSLAALLRKMELWEEAATAYRRNYDLCEELDDLAGKFYAKKGLSDAAFAMADYAIAKRLHYETLVTAVERNIPTEFNYPIAGMAKVFERQGQRERAVEILSALRQHPLFIMSPLRQVEIRDIERWLDDLRDQMPARDYQQAVQRGEGQSVEDIARQLIDELSITMVDSPTIPAQPLVDPLTERELDVLRLLSEGRSNRQIAATLVIALGTVKTHVHNICTKLNASNRGEAVARARNLGILA